MDDLCNTEELGRIAEGNEDDAPCRVRIRTRWELCVKEKKNGFYPKVNTDSSDERSRQKSFIGEAE